jgi:transposase
VRAFLARYADTPTVVAVEAMTGWRFVAEECTRAGIDVKLAEPAETRARQDRKRRAKTDKLDARLLRELLMQDRVPESWIAPPHILDLRVKVRLRKTLVSQRTEWLQRIHAVLFHHCVPVQAGRLGRLEGRYAREQLAALSCRRPRCSRSRSRWGSSSTSTGSCTTSISSLTASRAASPAVGR